MAVNSSFVKNDSSERNTESVRIFQEILKLKKQIHFDVIKNKFNGTIRNLFCNWTYQLGMGIRRERDLHAHSIGKQFRLTQWHAELYCLSKNYDECAVQLLDNFHFQHKSLFQVVQNVPVGTSALVWKEIEKHIENLVNIHRPSVFYCVSIYKRYYRIPLNDLTQVAWMVLVESIQHYDVEMGVPFITYYMIRIKVYLRRAYTNSCDIILRDDEFLQFAKLQYLLEKNNEDPTNPSFIKRCKALFNVDDVGALVEDHLMKYSAMNMADISKLPNISIQDESRNGTFEERNEIKSRDKALMTAINQLDETTREILLMNFGFKDERHYNREEIALKLKIPVCRVRALKNAALEKLKELMENPW
jgi:RNA polymerase sigma factor (sigma-70 family)